MINSSRFFALLNIEKKHDNCIFFKDFFHKKNNISVNFEIQNIFRRNINGKGDLLEINKFIFFVNGEGKLPEISSNDIYFLDSFIELHHSEFKKRKNEAYIFYEYKKNDFSMDKFIKNWKHNFKNDVCKIVDNPKILIDTVVVPILHCKIVAKRQLKDKWSLEIIEI